MRIRTPHVKAGESAFLTHSIVDQDGAAIAAADLDTLTLTLYDEFSGDVINERDAQDVLNANGTTVNSLGGVEIYLEPDDNIITDSDRYREWHVVELVWTYTPSGTTLTGKSVLKFKVWNHTKPIVDSTNSVTGCGCGTRTSWFSHRGWC
jgi:hypothetical protein